MEYRKLLDRIHRHLLPRVYLEVGLRHGDTLRLALPCTDAIGIDPAPNVLVGLGDHVSIHRATSDEFFDSGSADAALAGRPIDVAFIDGMHLMEYALRDFCNIERRSSPDTVVFVHDCLPRSPEEASRVPVVLGWTGDVWKMLLLLSTKRPDLEIALIKAPPTGLAMIRRLDATSRVINPKDDEMLEPFLALEFAHYQEQLPARFPVLEPEWGSIVELLPSPFQGLDDVEGLVAQRDRQSMDLATRVRRAKMSAMRSPALRPLLKARRRFLNMVSR